MDCGQCGQSNRAVRRFCGGCGAALSSDCPSCGFANEPGELFCGGCGAATAPGEGSPVPAARPAVEKERRQVTVLFADVVSFTSISERLDPEAVHAIMEGCFAILTREVGHFGGRISAFTGDGAMALFGAPLTEEDHAARAVHAALAIQDAAVGYGEEVRRSWDVELRLRIGLNTGLVLAGGIGADAPGDPGAVELTALGDTVNLASRLESAAPPGGILAGEATRRAAGAAVEWRAVGALTLKGKSEPVAAWTPVRADAGQSRFGAVAQRGLTEFVGRRPELETLVDAWRSAARGEGQVVSVVGEAGLGKSRLVHEFKRRMASAGVAVVEGSCFTYGDAISYLPFLEVLRALCAAGPGEPSGDAGSDLDARARELGLDGAAPYLRHVSGLDPADDRLALQPATTVRQRTVEALAATVLAAASTRPMVLVLEDVHWIDKASEEVLAAVAEGMAAVPLLLLLVHRPEYLYGADGASGAAVLRGVLGKPYARRVPLARLSASDSDVMTRQVLGSAHVPAGLAELVESSTDGNPLFIEELVRDLVESGHLVDAAGDGIGYRLSVAAALAPPTTIQGVLLARVDRLGPDLKALLQVASALGRVFSYPLLAAVAPLGGGLDRALLQLEDLDLVHQSALAPERQYSFKHVLTQEAIYQTLVRERREGHHARAGRAIESLYGDRIDDWTEILAHHYVRSGDDAKALDYLALAHRKANRTFSLVAAKAVFVEAMAILDRIPATAETELRRISFLADQMLVSFFLNETTAYYEVAVRYQDAAERLDDLSVRGMFLERLGMCLVAFGRIPEGNELLERAAATCRAGGNVAGAGVAYSMLAWSCLWGADLVRIRDCRASALAAFEVEFEPLHAMWARTSSTWASAHRGAWAEAIEEGLEALRDGEAQANDSLIAFSSLSLCIAYTGAGRLEEAIRCGERALRTAPTPAEALWATTAVGQAWARSGRAGEAVGALAAAAPLYESSGFVGTWMWNGVNLGEAYWRAGRPDQARAVLEAMAEVGRRHGLRFYLGSALRLLGEVTRDAGTFEQSLAVLTEVGAENELALAHAGYARLCRARDDPGTARGHLVAALAIFERLGTLTEPGLVRQDLADLDSSPGASGHPPVR